MLLQFQIYAQFKDPDWDTLYTLMRLFSLPVQILTRYRFGQTIDPMRWLSNLHPNLLRCIKYDKPTRGQKFLQSLLSYYTPNNHPRDEFNPPKQNESRVQSRLFYTPRDRQTSVRVHRKYSLYGLRTPFYLFNINVQYLLIRPLTLHPFLGFLKQLHIYYKRIPNPTFTEIKPFLLLFAFRLHIYYGIFVQWGKSCIRKSFPYTFFMGQHSDEFLKISNVFKSFAAAM